MLKKLLTHIVMLLRNTKYLVFLLALGLVVTPKASQAIQCIDLINKIEQKQSLSPPPFILDFFKTDTAEKAITEQLKAQDKALWRIDLQHFYEFSIRVLQKHVTGSSVRSTLGKERSRQLNLMHYLAQGKHNEAIDIYRKLFDTVELSFWVIKNTKQQLAELDQSQGAMKIKLEKRLFLQSRKFAQNYGEYIHIRNFLENATDQVGANPLFIETAQKVLRNLGVHKFSVVNPDYASLKIPEERVSLAEVKTLFRSSGQFTRLKLLGDFRNEVLSVFRYLLSAEILVSTVDNIISKFPPHAADKLKSLVGLMRSAHLRHRTLPLIIEIESLPHDQSLRLNELRKKNSITTNDELLVTYARTVEFTESFNDLKVQAKIQAELPNNLIMKSFYERLLAAEARALKLPDISLYEKISNIDVVFTLIQSGLIIKMTAPQVFGSVSEFFNFILTAGLF